MNANTIREELKKLSPEERVQVLVEFMPEFCRAVIDNPAIRRQMMSLCGQMQQHGEPVGAMGTMWQEFMMKMMRESE